MLSKFTVNEGSKIPSLQQTKIVVKYPNKDFKNMLLLMYSENPARYQYRVFSDNTVIKEGTTTPHNTLPFLIQWKGVSKRSDLNLDIKNLDPNSELKLNYLVSFFD